MISGAEIFVASLKRLGVSHIFTLVGDHLNELLREADRQRLKIFDTRHESAAVHMADGWSRITRRPGVSVVTGGPGHTNSITGIATANATGSPVVAVSGMSHLALRGRNAFQDMDQLSIVRGISKYAAVADDTAQLPSYLNRAFTEAVTGRGGVAHLSIPVDIFTDQVSVHAPLANGPIHSPRSSPDSGQLSRVVQLIRRAERPVVIAGSGTWWSDAGAELKDFIEKASLPLFTICLARGIVSDEHPLCFGYADPSLNGAAEKVFRRADLVLVLGKRIDYRLRLGTAQLFSPEAKFVQVDVHSEELGLNRHLEVGLSSDAKLTLKLLSEALAKETPLDRSTWLAEIQRARQIWSRELEIIASKSSHPMHPLHLFTALRDEIPDDATLCWDGGDFVHWGRCLLPARKPMRWLRLGALGGLGVGLPIGLAAKVLRPTNPVIVITGDGSLGFYLAEMDTAVRFGLPVVIIVGNDGGWGIERELQLGTYGDGRTVACELRRTRYDLIMKECGGEGEFVNRSEQIRPAMERALSSDKPYLINVDIKGFPSPFTQYQLRRKTG